MSWTRNQSICHLGTAQIQTWYRYACLESSRRSFFIKDLSLYLNPSGMRSLQWTGWVRRWAEETEGPYYLQLAVIQRFPMVNLSGEPSPFWAGGIELDCSSSQSRTWESGLPWKGQEQADQIKTISCFHRRFYPFWGRQPSWAQEWAAIELLLSICPLLLPPCNLSRQMRCSSRSTPTG